MYQGLREASNGTAQIGGVLHSALQPCRAIGLAEADRTLVHAQHRGSYSAWKDATPRDWSTFNTLGLSHTKREPRPDTSFDGTHDRPFPNSKV